jgi:hypothetical protein
MYIDYDDTLSSKELDIITEITFNLPDAEIPDAIEQLSTAGRQELQHNCEVYVARLQDIMRRLEAV